MGQAMGNDTVRNGLLAMLLGKGLVRQPEVTVTTSVAWLCQRAGGSAALQELIADSAGGLQVGGNAAWMAEVRAPDGTRTDLECHWGDPRRPRVVIEAKIGAVLHVQQIIDYLKDQGRRLADEPGDALLVLLVPAHRRPEADRVLAEAVEQGEFVPREGKLHTEVWDYDQLLDALARSLENDPDLAQLRLFIEACEALDIRPFTMTELRSPWGSRAADLITVLDRATSRVNPPGQRLMPSGAHDHYEWRRYLEVVPGWTNIAVGLLRGDQDPPAGLTDPTCVWLRVHRDTPDAQLAGRRLRGRFPKEVVVDDSGHTWLPLRVPPGVGGAAMVDEVATQIEAAVQAVGAPETASER